MIEISSANHPIPYSFSLTTPNCLWSFSESFFTTPRKPWLRARFARSRPRPRILKRYRMVMMRNLQSRRNPRKRSKRLTHHWMSVQKRRCNSSTHITAMQASCTVGFEFYLTSLNFKPRPIEKRQCNGQDWLPGAPLGFGDRNGWPAADKKMYCRSQLFNCAGNLVPLLFEDWHHWKILWSSPMFGPP